MRHIFLLLIFTSLTTIVKSQEIDMKISFFGYSFNQDSQKISWNDVLRKAEGNFESHALIKKAKTQNLISNIVAFTGGGLIGWTIGTAAGGGDPNWGIASIGGGIALIGFPLTFGAKRNLEEGIRLYNESVTASTQSRNSPEFSVVTNGNGFGFSVRF